MRQPPKQAANKTKKLTPLVRTMIMVDLVFLAGVQMVSDYEIIHPLVGTIASVVGLVVLIVALGIQFRSASSDHRLGRR